MVFSLSKVRYILLFFLIEQKCVAFRANQAKNGKFICDFSQIKSKWNGTNDKPINTEEIFLQEKIPLFLKDLLLPMLELEYIVDQLCVCGGGYNTQCVLHTEHTIHVYHKHCLLNIDCLL